MSGLSSLIIAGSELRVFFVGWLVVLLLLFLFLDGIFPCITKFGFLCTQDLNLQHESKLFMSTITTLGTEPSLFYRRSACEPLHLYPP